MCLRVLCVRVYVCEGSPWNSDQRSCASVPYKQLWDLMHEQEEMLPIFLRAPGVNLDEGVKQVLSVGASRPIRDADIHIQGFRGVSNKSLLFAIKLAP